MYFCGSFYIPHISLANQLISMRNNSTKLFFAFLFLGFFFNQAKAQLYFGGAGTWTGSVWSTTNSAPYTSPWVNNSAAVFNIAGSTVTFASTGVTSITANENVTFTAGGTMTTNGTVMPITVAAGRTVNMAGQNISTVAGTGIRKEGPGILISANGNLYPGGFVMNAGTMVIGGVNAMGGGGALNINGGALAAAAARNIPAAKYSGINIGGNFAFGAAGYVSNISFADNVALGASVRNIDLNGTAGTSTYTFGGVVSGAGGLTVGTNSGNGILVLSGNNTYSGNTTVTAGDLRLTPSANMSLPGGFNFNGGTLSTTGIAAGRTITYGSIGLSNSSTFNLAAATAHTITFSAAGSFIAGRILTINNWAGTIGSSGTMGRIFVGSSASSLTSSQLCQIQFNVSSVNYPAMLLATGELVPANIPTTSSISPATENAGNPSFTITVNGTNFINGSVVTWNGSPLVTTFVSSAQLTATVPAANIASVGTANVGVSTNCFASGTQTFTINPGGSNFVDWCNLQGPATGSIPFGNAYNVYGRVYEPGVTDAAGQGGGILAWIGYSTSNTDPAGGGWTWVAATYFGDAGNDDEYVANIGPSLTPAGTYYYATRFQISGGPYRYGGYNAGGGGYWDGTANINGEVTVDVVDWCNLQSPPNGTIIEGGAFNVYAQVYEVGVTPGLRHTRARYTGLDRIQHN